MLDILHGRGLVAIAGRRDGPQRLWDLAERWYPETESVSHESRPAAGERRFRALGVRLTPKAGRHIGHLPTTRCPTHHLPLSPFDRHDPRPRPRRGALGLPLPARDVRPESEARVRLLRAPDPARRPDRRRIEPQFDRKTKTLRVLGTWETRPAQTKQLRASPLSLGAEQTEENRSKM